MLGVLWICTLQAQPPRYFYSHSKISALTPGAPSFEDQDKWGEGIATIGDLDGDGIEEIAVGAPNVGEGTVFILFPSENDAISAYTPITQETNGFNEKLTPGTQFGVRVAPLGDWDRDGVPDLLVGQPKSNTGPINYGSAWILLLRRDGTVKNYFEYSGRTEGLIGKLGRDRRFGADLTAMGDIDFDGVEDIAIGAPMLMSKGEGEVWLLLLHKDGSIKEAIRYSNDQNGFPKKGLKPGDQFGASLSSYRRGSGILFVGALGDDKADLNAGAIWRLRIEEDGQLSEAQKITSKQGFGPKLKAQDRWGTSLATIGDWNGDGLAELAVSASRADEGGRDMGTIYILFMDSVQNVQYVNRFYQDADNFSGKLSKSYNFGRSLAKGPDHNQDGEADLLINGHLDDESGPNQGAFWIVSPQIRSAANAKLSELEQRTLNLTAEDSAWIYRDAITALDSAQMDSLYDLSSYAPSHLIFVLDVSASMNKPLRLPLLREAFLNLLVYMRPEDKISIVAYSSKAETLLSNLSAAERDSIAAAVEVLASSGSTKPTKAVEIAYALANRHLIPNGNNRIIFATDGGFDTEVLDKPLEKFANSDIPLSVFYFGKLPTDKIVEMEMLAQKAFGNTAHILPQTVNSALLNEVRVIQERVDTEKH